MSSSSSHVKIPLSFQTIIHYEPKYRALICLLYHHAIGLKATEKHLMHNHRINFDQRTQLRIALENIDAAEKIKAIPIPLDDQESIKGLTIYNGYKCNDCDKMKTVSLPVIRQHRYDEHREVGNQINWSTVSLQRWCRVENSKYWVVKAIETPSGEVTSDLGSWTERMKKMEADRLNQLMRKELEVTDRSNVDDTTSWLIYTKWSEMFKGKNIYDIGRLRYETLARDLERKFKRWTGRRMAYLGTSVDIIISRSKETLASTPSGIRMWLRSVRRLEQEARPFKLVQKVSTEKQYVRYWKQFLFYCFRVYELDEKERQKVYGIEFTKEQLRCMKEVDDLLEEVLKENEDVMRAEDVGFDSESEKGDLEEEEDSSDEEEELENEEDEDVETEWVPQSDMTLEKRLSEKVFELCMLFVMQTFRQLEEQKSPWIHFCGVLAIDWRKERFREPRNYTCIVAGILWVTRLFFLEYSLPKYEYESLNWSSRDFYKDFNWRFEEVRQKYLLRSSCTAARMMIKMLAYGKELSKQMGREPVIT